MFDTNVLLNLYRYRSNTRDELLNILDKLSDRIWIPHHVALEFQRNRLSVIADQNKRYNDVRRVIEKTKGDLFSNLDKLQLHRRHSLIDLQSLISGFENLSSQFLADLDRLQETQQKLTTVDLLKARLDDLFNNHVGEPPDSQKSLDDLYKLGEVRYKAEIPPGYLDAKKNDEYINNGIIYKRKYGDFLIWQQILTHCKSSNQQMVIVVTDDVKDDWWWKIDFDGSKTIGPRPELVDEARLVGGIETFLLYKTESFLNYANKLLKTPVSDATINEVRDLSSILNDEDTFINEEKAELAVYLWIKNKFPHTEEIIRQSSTFLDVVIRRNSQLIGFEVKLAGFRSNRFFQAIQSINRDSDPNKNPIISELSELNFVLIVENQDDINDALRYINRMEKKASIPVSIIIGVISHSDSEYEKIFQPLHEFRF